MSVDETTALVAERDAALEALGRAQRRAVALSDLAHRLAGSETRLDVTSMLSTALPDVLDCDASAVWLWDAARGEVRAAATEGLAPELHEALLSLSVKPSETPELAELLARREPLVLNAGAVTPVLEQMLAALSLKAAIGVALLSGDRLLGAVTACWADQPLVGAALTEAVQRLQGVADQAAIALLKAELVDRARHQSLHDALTGLPNRVLFHRRLEQALQVTEAEASVAVLFCDLDRFKHVNDELGHAAGDEVLREVASRLAAAVGDEGTVGRLSGDEFAVLLPAADDQDVATEVGRRAVQALDGPLRIDGRQLRLTMSVGVALHTGPLGRSETLLRSADAAMYAAKRRGRGQVVVAATGDQAVSDAVSSLAVELRGAVSGGQLRLHLQPVFTVDDAPVLVAAEALVRWEHPRLGLLVPATFLPIAEDDGTIVEIDLWMLRAACREASRWGGPEAPQVAVNVSVRTLLDDRLHEAVRVALVSHDLPPHRLQLELLESRALRDLPMVVDRLTALRHLGVRVALDDFGTGFSTLSWLQQVPVDAIKVDRSFTVDTALVGDDRRRRVANALLHGMVSVGEELAVDVLVEGVETPEQLRAVQDAGCRFVQGYLLGRPGPAEDLHALLPGGPPELVRPGP